MKTRNAIGWVVLAELTMAALGILFYGVSVEGLQATTRFSGRLSLFIFSFIFLLHPRTPGRLHIYLSENYFLVFAVAHGIHLLELLSYVYLDGIALEPYRVAGGFLAYALIFIVPWLKEQVIVEKIPTAKFQIIGWVYLYYVWLIFFMTYLSRVNGGFNNSGGGQIEHRILMAWVCAMLAWKLFQELKEKLNPTRLA